MDIIVRILEFVDNRGATLKTHILYSANLNSKSLDKFLSRLIESGLISTSDVNEKSYYFVTAKGRIFLKYISRALVILRSKRLSVITKEVERKLGDEKKEQIAVKEGLTYRGASGTPYVLPLAFISHNRNKVIAGTEFISAEMTVKEAINVVAWTWVICKDMNILPVVLVPETQAQILAKVMESFTNSKATTPTLVKYNRYESAEIIANRLLEVIRRNMKE